MSKNHTLRVRLLSLLLLTACNSNSNGTPAASAASIGAQGGTVEVKEGPLAGARLVIPPGALDRDVQISLVGFFAPAQPAFRSVGQGVQVLPSGTTFHKPAQLTLPFRDTVTGAVDVLLQSAGQVVHLAATETDASEARVTVAVGASGQFWAAQRYFDGVTSSDYLPLESGNYWEFDNGVTMKLTFSSDEPNMQSAVTRMSIEGKTQTLGFYLEAAIGGIQSLGEFGTMRNFSYQYLHPARPLMPDQIVLNQPTRLCHSFDGYEPLGSRRPTVDGIARVDFDASSANPLKLKVGTFKDLLEIRIESRFTDLAGQSQAQTLVLTLQRFVGPVAIEVFGSRGELVKGEVDGDLIGK